MQELSNTAYESAIISVLLKIDAEHAIDILNQLAEIDFSSYAHKALYAIIHDIVKDGRELNTLNIVAECKSNAKLLRILGGEESIYETIEMLSNTDINIEEYQWYIENIKKYSLSRQLVKKCDSFKEQLFNKIDKLSINDVLDETQKLYTDVVQDNITTGHNIGDDLEYFVNRNMKDVGKLLGIPSKFSTIRLFTLGYQPGCVYTYSGFTNEGKSLLLLNEANYIAIDCGIPTLLIDTEMTRKQQQPRLLSIRTGLNPSELRLGTFLHDPGKIELVNKQIRKIQQGKLYFVSVDDFDENTISRIIQYYIVKHNVRIVFFDYIKMPSIDRSDGLNETQKLGNLTNHLKNLVAKRMELPLITACQTDQFDHSREADSARIRRFSDFLANWQKIDDFSENGQDRGDYSLAIKKNRDGEKDITIYFEFNGKSMEIIEGENKHIDTNILMYKNSQTRDK